MRSIDDTGRWLVEDVAMTRRTYLRERLGLPLLLLLASLGAYGAGLAWMTHMHHRGLEYVGPAAMAAYDAGYETVTDVTVIPVSVAGLGCAVALLALRPRGVSRWMIGLSLVLQVSVLVIRVFTWGTWADEVREVGNVRLPDGSFHDAYSQYMDTNWIRIVLISSSALVGLAMAIRATAVLHASERKALAGAR